MTLMDLNEKKNLGFKLVEESKKLGFDDIILYFEDSQSCITSVSRQEADEISFENSLGIYVKLYKNHRCFNFSTANLDFNSIIDNIKQVNQAISYIPSDIFQTVSEKKEVSKIDLKIYDSDIHKLTNEDRINFLLKVENNALNYDKLIKIDICKLFDIFQETLIITSKGFCESYIETDYNFIFSVVTQNDDIGTEYDIDDGSRFFSELNKNNVELTCVKRALELRSNKKIKSNKMSIYLEPRISSEFFSYIEYSLNASLINKNISFLAEKLGKSIGNNNITILDNPLEIGRSGSIPFDAEGLPTYNKTIIENGTIKTAFHDIRSANKMGVYPTANAIRSSYQQSHSISSHNLVIKNGNTSPEDIISSIKEGIYVYCMTDTGGVDIISGNFSVEAKGLYIKNGKIVKALNNITLASTLLEMIKNIKLIGNNQTWVDDIAAPSILIDNIMVSC